MKQKNIKKLAWMTLTLAALTLTSACQPKEDGRKTRLRPDVRRKINGPTLDNAYGSKKPGGATTPSGLHMSSDICDLIPKTEANEMNPAREACDAILVQTDEAGAINIDSFHNIANVESGLELTAEQLQRYSMDSENKPTMDPNGMFFAFNYKSVKGQKMEDGRDVLYLTYVLPFNINQVDESSLTLKVNEQETHVAKNDRDADVLISEWSNKIILRITNTDLLRNINFDLQIRGKFKPEAKLELEVQEAEGEAPTPAEPTSQVSVVPVAN